MNGKEVSSCSFFICKYYGNGKCSMLNKTCMYSECEGIYQVCDHCVNMGSCKHESEQRERISIIKKIPQHLKKKEITLYVVHNSKQVYWGWRMFSSAVKYMETKYAHFKSSQEKIAKAYALGIIPEVYTSEDLRQFEIRYATDEVFRNKFENTKLEKANKGDKKEDQTTSILPKSIVQPSYAPKNETKQVQKENTASKEENPLFEDFIKKENERPLFKFVPREEKKTEVPKKKPYAFVDGSFNAYKKVYGYGCYFFDGEKGEYLKGNGNDANLASMRNVAGEIMGATEAIKHAIKKGLDELTIYYDYEGIEKWATLQWKATKDGTMKYQQFCRECPIKIFFKKVKAHSGIKGNEIADQLAKQAVGL